MFNRLIIPKDTFRELNIPISLAQMRDLEKWIKKGVNTEPIPVWQNYILTGYERYDLCEKYHRGYRVTDMFFTRKHEAVAWVCRKQLERKDLCRPAVCWLIYRLYSALQEAEKQKEAKDQFRYKMLSPSFRSESSTNAETENTALLKDIGEEYGLHKSTIRNYVRYGKQLDRLEEMFPGVRIRILKGEIEAPIMFMDAVMQMPKDQLLQMIHNPGCRKLQPPDRIRKKIMSERDPRYRKDIQINTAIKEMPAYDPDAELNRLTYTIETWDRSITRAKENADFQKTTEEGRAALFRALKILAGDTENLLHMLEEQAND